jgi:hypothetical protein
MFNFLTGMARKWLCLNFRYQAFSQLCAVCSPFSGLSMMLRQLTQGV